MTTLSTRQLRAEELRRRVDALPREVEEWRVATLGEVDKQLHASQMAAIAKSMELLVDEQKRLFEALDPAKATFEDDAFELVKLIIKSQRVWDFYRDKLELRSTRFKDVMWVADTIAWDCYSRALQEIAQKVNVSNLREPPLTYLTAEFSPATWVRGSRPNDGRNYSLGAAMLPIPVIELPWDHVENVWELLSLLHEVGHDVEADLKLRQPLLTSLANTLTAAGVPQDRVQRWVKWEGETFADLYALQLGGPAFADALLNLLLLPSGSVTALDPDDPHPNHYVRILMNAAYVKTLGNDAALTADATRLHDTWTAIYAGGVGNDLAPFAGDFPSVFTALMDTKFNELNNHTVRELFPYSSAADGRIREAAAYLSTGQNKPQNVRPRHWVSAARLAVKDADPQNGFAPALDAINKRAMAMVRESAPPGVRAGGANMPHVKRFAQFILTSDVIGPRG
jgi:hypothetical protein